MNLAEITKGNESMFILSGKRCTKFLILYCVIMNIFVTILGVPSTISYICDVINLILLSLVSKRFGQLRHDNVTKWFARIFLLLFIYGCINQIINFVPIKMIFWGDRNFYRYYILFFAILIYMSISDVQEIMNIFYWIQIINLIYGLYKFLILGLQEDAFGGGIFPNGGGMNLFCILVSLYFANAYMNKTGSFFRMLTMLLSSFLLAVLAEEKFLILGEILVIIASFIVNNRFTIRKIIILGVGISAVIMGIQVLKRIIPSTYELLFNFSELMDYATVSYSEGYRIPRIGAFKAIDSLFLNTGIQKWIGLGLGNCDTSSFPFLQSSFYQQYGSYNYRWFTHQWTYLEMGRIGFFLYISFFIAIIIFLSLYIKKVNGVHKVFIQTSIIYSIITILFVWHSAATRIDTGYYIYFGLAMGLVSIKTLRTSNKGFLKMWENPDSSVDN